MKLNFFKNSEKYKKVFILIQFFMLVMFTFFSYEFPQFSTINFFVLTFCWTTVCVLFSIGTCVGISLFLSTFEIINVTTYPINLTSMMASVFVLVYGIKFFIKKIFKRKLIKLSSDLFLSIILILYGMINLQYRGINSTISNIVIIVLLYIVLDGLEEFNLMNMLNCFLWGLMVNILCGSIFVMVPSVSAVAIYNNERFMSLCGNPNQLQLFCVIGEALLLCIKFENSIYSLSFFTMFSIVLIAGFATLSKAFILCTIIVLIFYLVSVSIRNFKQGVIAGAICVAIGGVGTIIFRQKIEKLILRLFEYTEGGLLNRLLTGRVSIWLEYLNVWSSQLLYIIFGVGTSAPQIIDIGTHSGYVDMLYKYGIVGVGLIVLLVITYIYRFRKSMSKSVIRYLPMCMFLIISAEEMLFYTKYAFVFILLMLLIVKKDNKNFSNYQFRKESGVYDTKNYSLCMGRW